MTFEQQLKQLIQIHLDKMYDSIQQFNRRLNVPRISVDASTTEITTAFPDNTRAKSHISAIETKMSAIKEDGTGNNPMAVVEWTLDEGPYAGRRVGFHNVMLGGVTKTGAPMPLRQLFDLIEAVKAPWAVDSSKPLVARSFKKVKADNGNILFCDPDTGEVLKNVECNVPEDFANRQAMVTYGVRKQVGGDREFNEVKSVAPIA